MSKNKEESKELTTTEENKSPSEEDKTPQEKESLDRYKKNGCPGLTSLEETDVFKWFELYMSGKTYTEIAQITKSKKDLVMYVSSKGKWLEKRIEYYRDISEHIVKKTSQAKIDSINTLSAMVSALSKYYGKKFNEYLANNDDSIIEEMDTKMLAQYYKSTESLEKIMTQSDPDGDPDGDKAKGININLHSSNAQIKHLDDDSIEIKDDSVGEILKFLAGQNKDKK